MYAEALRRRREPGLLLNDLALLILRLSGLGAALAHGHAKIVALATVFTLASLVPTGSGATASAGLIPTRLRCEYRVDPLGLDVTRPRLSWVLRSTASDARGQEQAAYQVLVAGSPEDLHRGHGDLWDSGRVTSDQTIHVVYAGQPLASRQRCYWKVRVWGSDGQESPWSEPARWSMGLLDRSDWGAQWIGDPEAILDAAREAEAHRKVHSGYRSETRSAGEARWVVLDLGSPRQIDGLRLHPAQPWDWPPDAPIQSFPLRFELEAGNAADLADARTVVDRTGEDQPGPAVGEAPVYRFEPVRARYVRLRFTRLRRVNEEVSRVALAEVEVLSGGTNVARGAAVTAPDAMAVPGWSKDYLVDGRTRADRGDPIGLPATYLRKRFGVEGAIRRATVHVTAQGLYVLRLNGRRVGDHLLAPEWTSYHERLQYQTYDVTDHLRTGENVVGAALGTGWYIGRIGLFPARHIYGTRPRLLLRMDVELADGTTRTVVSDGTWRFSSEGPIRFADILDGEVQDARKAMPGWDAVGFDDRAWKAVQADRDLGPAKLVWQPNEPIRVVKELQPISISEPRPGVYVADMGQNMVGFCRLKVKGPAGATVTLRHGEMLNDDGTLYTANLRTAPQVDRFTLRGGGEEVFEPLFTYHGFRYVELTGLPERPHPDSITGRVMHSASPDTGVFETSSPFVNQLMRNIVWTQRANMHGIPEDCPQRDERLGWMGDIQSFSQTAIFNMDMAAFLTKWLQDVRDDQAPDGRYPDFAPNPNAVLGEDRFFGVPAWGDAGTVVPWRVYQNYADTRLLEQHFDSARRWVDFIHESNPDLLWEKARGNDYNDWLNGDTLIHEGWPKTGGMVPRPVFATAFFAHSTELVAKMAAVLGRETDEVRYRALFARIKAAFNAAYVEADGRIEGDTQAGYALALCFDLLPAALRPRAARHMVEAFDRYDGHLSTGIQTTNRLMLELTRNGYDDEAYRLLNLRTFPSWGFMIENGATTIWERWDGFVEGRGFQSPGMNSFNHWAIGAVGEWMWRNIVGIQPDEAQPGFKHFVVRPRPGGGLEWARGSYDSIRGRIESNWRIQGETMSLAVTVPVNTSATVYVPTSSASAVREGGQPAGKARGVRFLREEDGSAVYAVRSGTYEFTAPARPGAATGGH